MKHIITAILITLLTACFLCGTASAMTGSGTQSNPYIISSQADLALLSGNGYASYAGNDKYFELGADITMSGTFTPIGSNSYKFNGHFDGKYHKITGLKINSNPAGLFQEITSGAEIKNINIHNADILGTADGGTGALYGSCIAAIDKVTITNINVYDSKIIANNYHVGGIAGLAGSSNSIVEITNCRISGCIIKTTMTYAGGVAGAIYNPSTNVKITLCDVENSIISSSDAGGSGGIAGTICLNSMGDVESCNVKNCYIVASNTRCSGGIIGVFYYYPSGSITDCIVEKCTILSKEKAGGIVGNSEENTVSITNCDVLDCSVIATSRDSAGICGV